MSCIEGSNPSVSASKRDLKRNLQIAGTHKATPSVAFAYLVLKH